MSELGVSLPGDSALRAADEQLSDPASVLRVGVHDDAEPGHLQEARLPPLRARAVRPRRPLAAGDELEQLQEIPAKVIIPCKGQQAMTGSPDHSGGNTCHNGGHKTTTCHLTCQGHHSISRSPDHDSDNKGLTFNTCP